MPLFETAEFWSWISNIGFVFVIGGVVMEGAEILEKRFLNGASRKLRLVGDIGWLILVIGLTLEFYGHIRESSIQEKERIALASRLDKTTENAGRAIERAASNDLARVALEKELFTLRERAEEYDYLLLPRTFNYVSNTIPQLAEFKQTPFIVYLETTNQGDAISLSSEFMGILKASQWSYLGFQMRTNGPTGVRIKVNSTSQQDANSLLPAARRLYSITRLNGVAAIHEQPTTKSSSNFIAVHIGEKFPADDDKSVKGWWRVPKNSEALEIWQPKTQAY